MTDAANARRPLSLQAVLFGQVYKTTSLRRMAQIALEVQNTAQAALEAQKTAPDNAFQPAAATVPSSYAEAVDTVS